MMPKYETKVTEEERTLILQLLDSKFTVRAISEMTGIYKVTVTAIRQGYNSYIEYQKHLAEERGFESYTRYQEHWAKHNGFGGTANAIAQYVINNGPRSLNDIMENNNILEGLSRDDLIKIITRRKWFIYNQEDDTLAWIKNYFLDSDLEAN